MNRIGRTIGAGMLAFLCTGAALAQNRYESAVPRALPEQRVAPSRQLDPQPVVPSERAAPAPTPRTMQLQMNSRRAAHDADARHCLSLASNRQIHRCAVPYLHRASRRSAAKPRVEKTRAARSTSQKTSPAVVEMTKPGVLKPGAPRPDDRAKAAELVKPMDVTKASPGVKSPEPAAKGAAPAATAAAKSAASKAPPPSAKAGEPPKK